ncbi:MAG: redoxin domain-containing protein [Prevotellaceae bacterium]|jgi:peroxiredoxin|nr:redoxin domain-containing protein [Prevotellaceae bacterium]
MKRKVISFSFVVLFTTVIIFLVFKIFEGQKMKELKGQNMNELPDFCLNDLWGAPYCLEDLKGSLSVIILFAPYCSNCENEIIDLIKHKEYFEEIPIIMITNANELSCKEYYVKNNLFNLTTLHILRDTANDFFKYSGISAIPSTFLYDENRRLIQQFAGETKAKTIISYLKE